MECENKIRETALIDWFRFTCLWSLDVDHPCAETRQLFQLLKVNSEVFTTGKNYLYALNYAETIVFDADVKVGIHPKEEAKVLGVPDQFIVDLSGSACRSFEMRGGSWKELIDFLCSSSCRFNRIDLALDDIDGVLDMDYIRNRISLQAFSSVFRGKKMNGKVGDEIFEKSWFELDDLDDKAMKVIDSRKGYTCTFGSRHSSTLLNIYDKLSERESRGLIPGVQSWVRFEASFIRDKCDYCVRHVLSDALKSGTFGKVVAGIMRGLIEFKEVPRNFFKSKVNVRESMSRHIDRLKIDRRYSKFLSGVKSIKLPSNQAKVEASVQRTVNWAKGYWLGSLAALFASPSVALQTVLQSLGEKIDSKELLTWQFVCRIQSYARNVGIEMTVDEILDNLQTYLNSFGVTVDVRKVFLERLAADKKILTDTGYILDDLELGDDLDECA